MENVNINKLAFFEENPADFIKEHRQYYLMVNAISKRVRQLQLGDRALALPANGSRDPVYIAQEEFLQNKLAVTERKAGLHLPDFVEDDMADMDALLGMDDEELSFEGSDDEE